MTTRLALTSSAASSLTDLEVWRSGNWHTYVESAYGIRGAAALRELSLVTGGMPEFQDYAFRVDRVRPLPPPNNRVWVSMFQGSRFVLLAPGNTAEQHRIYMEHPLPPRRQPPGDPHAGAR